MHGIFSFLKNLNPNKQQTVLEILFFEKDKNKKWVHGESKPHSVSQPNEEFAGMHNCAVASCPSFEN